MKKQDQKFVKAIQDIREVRLAGGRNQADFWSEVGVTQSGGSRYENERDMPRPVKMLLALNFMGSISADQLKTAREIAEAA
jgi:transcriptional regulator with XRE-family HTH domain